MTDETIAKIQAVCRWVRYGSGYEYAAVDAEKDVEAIEAELEAHKGHEMQPEDAFEHAAKSCDADHADWYDDGLCKDCTIDTLRTAMTFAATHGRPSDYEAAP